MSGTKSSPMLVDSSPAPAAVPLRPAAAKAVSVKSESQPVLFRGLTPLSAAERHARTCFVCQTETAAYCVEGLCAACLQQKRAVRPLAPPRARPLSPPPPPEPARKGGKAAKAQQPATILSSLGGQLPIFRRSKKPVGQSHGSVLGSGRPSAVYRAVSPLNPKMPPPALGIVVNKTTALYLPHKPKLSDKATDTSDLDSFSRLSLSSVSSVSSVSSAAPSRSTSPALSMVGMGGFTVGGSPSLDFGLETMARSPSPPPKPKPRALLAPARSPSPTARQRSPTRRKPTAPSAPTPSLSLADTPADAPKSPACSPCSPAPASACVHTSQLAPLPTVSEVSPEPQPRRLSAAEAQKLRAAAKAAGDKAFKAAELSSNSVAQLSAAELSALPNSPPEPWVLANRAAVAHDKEGVCIEHDSDESTESEGGEDVDEHGNLKDFVEHVDSSTLADAVDAANTPGEDFAMAPHHAAAVADADTQPEGEYGSEGDEAADDSDDEEAQYRARENPYIAAGAQQREHKPGDSDDEEPPESPEY